MLDYPLFNNFISFQKNIKGKSIFTLKSYTIDIEEFSSFSKDYDIKNYGDVDFDIIRNFIIFLVEDKKISNRSINRKISSLRCFFKYLQQNNNIKKNPTSKQPFLKELKKKSIPLSRLETFNLLDDTHFSTKFEGIRDKFILELFYSTGIRRIELMELKVSDFDTNLKQLKVLGKGNKERFVPLTDNLIFLFQDYFEEIRKINPINNFLIIKRNGKRITKNYISKKIKDYISSITTKKKASPHILRHSFATHISEEGADINYIKEMLGHSSLSSTQIYVSHSIEKLKNDFLNSHPRAKLKE